MIIGLPVWTAALDIANSSLAKKVPYSIAPPPEHMATDPISLVEQLKKISSISIDIDFDETLDKLHRCTLKVHKTWRIEPSTVHIRYALADVVLIYMLWCAYNRPCANSKDNARLPSQEATKK